MSFKLASALAVCLAMSCPLYAQEDALEGMSIRPGLYDVTMTETRGAYVNDELVKAPPQSRSGQACLKPEKSMLKAEDFNRPGCEITKSTIEPSGIYYDMACSMGGPVMGGSFKVQAGRLVDGFLSYNTADYYRLPDGHAAAQNFAMSGKLQASQSEVLGWMDLEIQYIFAGECPDK